MHYAGKEISGYQVMVAHDTYFYTNTFFLFFIFNKLENFLVQCAPKQIPYLSVIKQ